VTSSVTGCSTSCNRVFISMKKGNSSGASAERRNELHDSGSPLATLRAVSRAASPIPRAWPHPASGRGASWSLHYLVASLQ
jgi:hypothetical protein